MINQSWTKIYTPFLWNCLIDYHIVTCYLLLFLESLANTSLLYKIVITVKLSQFDNSSSWSESLFVINKFWIRRKYFVFSASMAVSTFKWFHCHQLSRMNSACLWSRVRLAINKKYKYFLLPSHLLALNLILVFSFKEKKTKG